MLVLLSLLAALALGTSCSSSGPGEKGGDYDLPRFADISLCYGGGLNKEPFYWDADRFAPQVSYIDSQGQEKWLFEAFLLLGDYDGVTGRWLTLSAAEGRKNGNKVSWISFLDYWTAPGGAIEALDEAIAKAASRLGEPPSKRKIVMAMPDPVQFEIFADKTSSTLYWGDGLDFSRSEDQVKAYKWYIDQFLSRMAKLAPKYLETAGFYILSEDLVIRPDGLNYQYKRWDRILPHVGDYLHGKGLGMYWIPWNFAPGWDSGEELGIDMVWMQPGYYWDEKGEKPLARTLEAIVKEDISMEFEFEYSLCREVMQEPGKTAPDSEWRMVKTIDDLPAFRERFREYMKVFKEYGLYGTKPIALYSGTNTIWQLANSAEPDDRAFWLEFCEYITSSPLRNK